LVPEALQVWLAQSVEAAEIQFFPPLHQPVAVAALDIAQQMERLGALVVEDVIPQVVRVGLVIRHLFLRVREVPVATLTLMRLEGVAAHLLLGRQATLTFKLESAEPVRHQLFLVHRLLTLAGVVVEQETEPLVLVALVVVEMVGN
jgi:hypothetical protein